MKRTKQVQKMIDATNVILKDSHLTFANKYDESNPASWLFSYFTHLLLRADCYKGYNEFHEVVMNGKTFITHVGNENIPESEKFIQFN